MILVCRWAFAVMCLLASTSSSAPLNPESSLSTSRQFLVYGTDIRLRGVLCEIAESTKRDVLQLVGERDAWTAPIVIHAQSPRANLPELPPATLSLGQTGAGLKLQLNLKIASDLTEPEIRRQVLTAVLVEMMYRRLPGLRAGTTCSPPPQWLLDGVLAHSERSSGAKRTAIAGHKALSIEGFLQWQPDSLDAPGRSLYRAYSGVLIDLLIHLPRGRYRLARFIFDRASASDDGPTNLRMQFPELSDPTGSLQRSWMLKVARLSISQSGQFLSGEETERILNKILELETSITGSGKKHQLHEFPVFIRDLSARPALLHLCRELKALAERACPVYRPVIHEYERVATLLARKKTKGIAERLARLSASRKLLSTRMRKIGDYMNWFEATRSEIPSGLFDQYMKAADSADRTDDRRRDPLSVYLDVLEPEFQD